MFKKKVFIFLFVFLFSILLVQANYNLFPNTGEKTKDYSYIFNFTTDSACSNSLYDYQNTTTTNNRGFSFLNIGLSGFTQVPRYLCEYRDSVLRKTHTFPHGIFNITFTDNIYSNNWSNVTITEAQISDFGTYWKSDGSSTATGNWDISPYNLTASYFSGNTNTPTSNDNLVNKKYVDDATSATAFDFFLTDETSSISGWYNMTDNDLGGAESALTTGTLATGTHEIFNWTNQVALPFNVLRQGIVDVHLHMKVTASGKKDVTITPKLYNASSDGSTRTLIQTFETSGVLTTTETEYDLHGTLSSEYDLPSGNILVLELEAEVSGAGGDPAIEVEMEGLTDSHISVETTTNAFSNIFVRQDGTTALTGNWDVGSFWITALGLNSSDWTNVTITESQISDLTHTTDTWALNYTNYNTTSELDNLFAKYQFTTNNFNGSGDFNTTGDLTLGSTQTKLQGITGDFLKILDLKIGGSARVTADGGGASDNLVLNAKGTGAVYFNFDDGTGGLIFSNGAGGTISTFTSGGFFTLPNMNVTGTATVDKLNVTTCISGWTNETKMINADVSTILSNCPCWVMANGTTQNGYTPPDMRDRDLVGAGNSFSVGATGGSVDGSNSWSDIGHSHNVPQPVVTIIQDTGSGTSVWGTGDAVSDGSEADLSSEFEFMDIRNPYHAVNIIMYMC